MRPDAYPDPFAGAVGLAEGDLACIGRPGFYGRLCRGRQLRPGRVVESSPDLPASRAIGRIRQIENLERFLRAGPGFAGKVPAPTADERGRGHRFDTAAGC